MAVSNSLLAKISSSFGESAERRPSIGDGVLCQHLIALGLLRVAHSERAFHELAGNLIRIAEHSIGLRDMQALAEASEILSSLPLAKAKQAGAFYYALAMKRGGQTEYAQRLLEKIAESPNTGGRARALQSLGVMLQEQGKLHDAGRLYLEAMRAGGEHDLITALSARETISAIKSANGDHQGALSDLENLLPLFRLAAKEVPFYFYVYHADLAYELAQVGRIREAKAACAVALASPFAPAYPEWSATRDEIAAKHQSAAPSVVAISRTPDTEPSSQIKPRPKQARSRALVSNWPALKKVSVQRSIIPIAEAPAITSNGMIQSILDWMRICIGPRGPPALS